MTKMPELSDEGIAELEQKAELGQHFGVHWDLRSLCRDVAKAQRELDEADCQQRVVTFLKNIRPPVIVEATPDGDKIRPLLPTEQECIIFARKNLIGFAEYQNENGKRIFRWLQERKEGESDEGRSKRV